MSCPFQEARVTDCPLVHPTFPSDDIYTAVIYPSGLRAIWNYKVLEVFFYLGNVVASGVNRGVQFV